MSPDTDPICIAYRIDAQMLRDRKFKRGLRVTVQVTGPWSLGWVMGREPAVTTEDVFAVIAEELS